MNASGRCHVTDTENLTCFGRFLSSMTNTQLALRNGTSHTVHMSPVYHAPCLDTNEHIIDERQQIDTIENAVIDNAIPNGKAMMRLERGHSVTYRANGQHYRIPLPNIIRHAAANEISTGSQLGNW